MSNSAEAGEFWLVKGNIQKLLFLPHLEQKQNTAELSHFFFNKLLSSAEVEGCQSQLCLGAVKEKVFSPEVDLLRCSHRFCLGWA